MLALLGVKKQGGEDGITQFWAFEKTVYECVTIEGADGACVFNFYFLIFVEPVEVLFGGFLPYLDKLNRFFLS